MHSFLSIVRRVAQRVRQFSSRSWSWYRGRKRWQQIAIAVVLAILIIGGIMLLNSLGKKETIEQLRSVTLQSVGQLSGTGGSVSIIGEVRSVTEAAMLAQTGGTVRAVQTKVGAAVPAGFVIAQLENASERAAVLSAEGAYESALAARSITQSEAGDASDALKEAETAARNTYRTAFTSVDSTLTVEVQSLFNGSSINPGFLLRTGSGARLSEEYRELRRTETETWRRNLAIADTKSPDALLDEAQRITERLSVFLVELSRAAAQADSGATATQKANIAAARADVDATLASISTARDAYRAKKTAAEVAETQTETRGGQVASADASVKSALGNLRSAQAQLEKTLVRAPIGGTVNFLPIRVGDYVTAFTHVATVAQNGALEIVAYVSEGDRELLAAGTQVTVENEYPGLVTSIAPALDPVTKQIEVRIALQGAGDIVNGQSVRIALPTARPVETTASTGPILLPLTALKLTPSARVVFTIGEDGRLVGHPVEIGEVRGDRIEIRTPVAAELRIVTDARGLSEGQRVNVGEL